MPNRTLRSAFTMVELLVVIAIMALLAAITISSAKALGIGSKKAATETIIAAVRKGITLSEADRGGSVSPVEHPFAGSRAPRFAFKAKGGTTVSTATDAAYGPAVTDGAQLGSGGSWAKLIPTDVFNNQAVPLLFGYRREYMYVLGSQQKRVTSYHRMPKPVLYVPPSPGASVMIVRSAEDVVSAVGTASPLTLAAFPDDKYLIPSIAQRDAKDANGNFTYGRPDANKVALDYMFGSSGIAAELSALKGLYEAYVPPAGTPLTSEPKFRFLLNKETIGGDPDLPLAFTNVDSGTHPDIEERWKPGRLAVSSIAASGSTISTSPSTQWVQYRLPGLAIYDAWGVEILCSNTSGGSVRIISAGPDGAFRYSPGANRKLDTINPLAATPAADDQDGTRDNIPKLVGE